MYITVNKIFKCNCHQTDLQLSFFRPNKPQPKERSQTSIHSKPSRNIIAQGVNHYFGIPPTRSPPLH